MINTQYSGGYGPRSKDKLILSKSLIETQRKHNQYISNLSLWKQYIVWRYTIGSKSINIFLLGFNNEDTELAKTFWIYHFFKYYNNPTNLIEKPFKKWIKFFESPGKYLDLNLNMKKEIDNIIIKGYIDTLQSIILKAPVTMGDIMVYKVSSEYPELPFKNNFKPKKVYQAPFNSTSYDPQLYFSVFIADNADCCFFSIKIPKGSHVLIISETFH